MSPEQIARVAEYHASSRGCSPFILGGWIGEEVWRQHLEHDRRIIEGEDCRPRRQEEVDAIVAFLSR